jgi:hypothetical protein
MKWWQFRKRRALRHEWDRQVQVMHELGDDYWGRLPRPSTHPQRTRSPYPVPRSNMARYKERYHKGGKEEK